MRAESGLWTLLRGRITIFDGVRSLPTTDQHPFGFFLLLKMMVSTMGKSEFVLRYAAVIASTLLPAAVWVEARLFVRRGVFPRPAPNIALLLAALSPFFLWYGQEARMYSWLALMAVVSTYLLLRWTERSGSSRLLAGYLLSLFLFLTLHYFSLFLIPLHAALFYRALVRHRPQLALVIALALLIVTVLFGGIAAWTILNQPLGGTNFAPISLRILLPDLLNAFSLGLSVRIDRVWWLDLVFGLLFLSGIGWTLRNRAALRADGWIVAAQLVLPVLLLLAIGLFQPAYMNARHMSLIGGPFFLLVGVGLSLLWGRIGPLGWVTAALLVGGMGYSTINYFHDDAFAKDDFASVGAYLEEEMLPGDLLILNPPQMLRLYRYYLPVDPIETLAEERNVGWLALPALGGSWETSLTELASLGGYRRIWLITSGMFPLADPDRAVESWLNANAFRVREVHFESVNSILRADLYTPRVPVDESIAEDAIPLDLTFGDAIRLAAIRAEPPLWPGSSYPVTLFWRRLPGLEESYKYRIQLFVEEGQERKRFPAAEREPYDGFLPTVWWPPDRYVIEHLGLAGPDRLEQSAHLSLEIYESESLTKLPVYLGEESREQAPHFSIDLPLELRP